MKRLLMTLALLSSTALLLTVPAFCQEIVETDAEIVVDGRAILAEKQQEQALWNDLQAARALDIDKGRIVVDIDPMDKALIDADEAQSRRIGLHLPVDIAVRMGQEKARQEKANGTAVGRMTSDADGSLVWTTSLQVTGANAVRIHFEHFQLPPQTALYLYNDDGQAHGPYTGRGPNDNGDFWSHTVFGEHVWIQLHSVISDAAKWREAAFDIAEVSHLGERFELPRRVSRDGEKADCSINISCIENAECYDWSLLDDARKAVARMLYEEDGTSYWCSGGLLNDNDSSDREPWFLTAHHCISTEDSANSLETYFQYQSSCGSCSASYSDSVLGASLWATGSGADFTLLRLSELPSGWALMGWTNAKTLSQVGTQLYRISHPQGSPQSFSQYEVLSTNGSKYIVSDPVIGATEGGSSGSPIFRADGKVVGQLRGNIYPDEDTYDRCDASTFDTIDGALSYYWQSVKPYLNKPTNTYKMHVSNVVASSKKISDFFPFYYAKAKVTVVDTLGNIVPFATVTGTFSGDVNGITSAVTDDQGQAIIQHPALFTSQQIFTFCVTNLTQDYFNTYDSASNVVTCDSN